MAPVDRGERRELNLSEPAPTLFYYTGAQWAEIEAAVASVRKSPLSKAERIDLLVAAAQYLEGTAERKNGTYAPPNEKMKSWRNLERVCGQLLEAIEIACKLRFGNSWRDEPIAPLEDWTAFGHVADLIAKIRDRAEEIGQSFKPSIFESVTGRLEPSVVFQQRILAIWTNQLGGWLTITRDSVSGEIKGPLVKYFSAVARPVMGDRMPSLKSLPDIVDRQKLFHKRHREAIQRFKRKLSRKKHKKL